MIESYVLGIADQQEVAELEQLRQLHPEINAAIADFEQSLEEAAAAHAVPVPDDVKQALFARLQQETSATDGAAVPLQTKAAAPVRSMARFVAAASIILLVASAALNIYFYNKYTEAEQKSATLAAERNTLYANRDVYQTKMTEMENEMRLMSDTAMLKIPLAGVKGKESNAAVVFWSKNTKDVYVAPSLLSPPPPGMQYQLWALVDGQPVDAGVIGDCKMLCKVKNINAAQAFAITLEKQGGSPSPNLEQLFVMGKAS